jgi:hypothetical protein
MASERTRLILDLDVDDGDAEGWAGSPRGWCSTPGSAPAAFSGWLQLAQAIETTLEAARRSGSASRGGRPSTDTDHAGCGPGGHPTDKGAQQ